MGNGEYEGAYSHHREISTSRSSMISLKFDDAMLKRAKEKAISLGSLNNSILKGAGNLAGYLAYRSACRGQDKEEDCCS